MTLRFDALVERWNGERMLFVRSLPGFVVSGASSSELAERTGTALRHHLQWLVERELIDEPEGEVDLHLSEERTATGDSIGPRFDADLDAPDENEVEVALAVGRAALSDLIGAFDDAEVAGANERSTASMRHIATMDRWYASRLGVVSLDVVQADPVDDIVSAAGTFEDAVDSLVESDIPELIELDGEEWTLAKVLRRRTAHLREHLVDLKPAVSEE